MSNPNDPAYPLRVPPDEVFPSQIPGETHLGMTIRQRFVMAAMQGLCARDGCGAVPATSIATLAIPIVDAALAEEARTRSTT